MISPGRVLGVILGTIFVSIGAGACGGSGSKSTSTKTHAAPATTTAPAVPTTPTAGGGTAAVTTGPVRGTLRGQNHAPRVKQSWGYSVTVTDAGGHPLSGTVDIEFVYGRQVVGHDTPPTHPVTNGHWHDTLTFPAAAVGEPLTFQAVVHTSAGSITLDWPIKVRQ